MGSGAFGRVLHWLQDTPEVPWPWGLQPVVAEVKILSVTPPSLKEGQTSQTLSEILVLLLEQSGRL